MTKRITLRIGPDGQVRADVSGFRGTACVDYISTLEKMLDAEAVDSQPTSEYYSNSNSITVDSVQHDPASVRGTLMQKD